MATTMEENMDTEDPETMSIAEIENRTRAIANETHFMELDMARLLHEMKEKMTKMEENNAKVKVNKRLPYLVANIVEILQLRTKDHELKPEDGMEPNKETETSAVIKTSTRQEIFLPTVGLVDPTTMKPGDLIGVNKDTFLVMETLPTEYDPRVKTMELDERPEDQFTDIGGLDKQITELIEAVILPVVNKEKFDALNIQPPKGVLLYGPPGTGKTLMARACAAYAKATFLKMTGTQLVQGAIGDGSKLVRNVFQLAKDKAPAIIFIDELDAIGTKRFNSDRAGDREVQRTLLELLNQLDGFSCNTNIKVIAATNREDVLDPALLRSGRLDRKIEFPLPNDLAREQIIKLHSRKMNTSCDVNFEELTKCTDGFNGSQCKAVCVEAGMIGLRRGAQQITHEDFMEGILEVQNKKKGNLFYYS